MKKLFSCSLTALGVIAVVIGLSWAYTILQLELARSKGAYPSAAAGMLARAEKYYSDDRDVRILYAGTNSFDGSKPHIWYVIAEIHASTRADGSELGHNGCDAPGSFFLQTSQSMAVSTSFTSDPCLFENLFRCSSKNENRNGEWASISTK